MRTWIIFREEEKTFSSSKGNTLSTALVFQRRPHGCTLSHSIQFHRIAPRHRYNFCVVTIEQCYLCHDYKCFEVNGCRIYNFVMPLLKTTLHRPAIIPLSKKKQQQNVSTLISWQMCERKWRSLNLIFVQYSFRHSEKSYTCRYRYVR